MIEERYGICVDGVAGRSEIILDICERALHLAERALHIAQTYVDPIHSLVHQIEAMVNLFVEAHHLLIHHLESLIDRAESLIHRCKLLFYEFKELKALGEIAGLQGIEPILTCPAGLDANEAAEMASVFSFLPIERMLITRTDAVRRLSGVFAALSASGYAMCNMSSSAAPSDACTALSPAGLSRLMLRHVRERTGA